MDRSAQTCRHILHGPGHIPYFVVVVCHRQFSEVALSDLLQCMNRIREGRLHAASGIKGAKADHQCDRDQPKHRCLHARFDLLIDLIHSRPQYERSMHLAFPPAFHSKSHRIFPVPGGTGRRVAMAQQAFLRQLDRMRINQLILLLVHREVFLILTRRQRSQNLLLACARHVLRVPGIVRRNPELVPLLVGDLLHRSPCGHNRNGFVKPGCPKIGSFSNFG